MKNKLAWTAGTKRVGYELVITLIDETREFHFLNHKRFESFRACQDLANAVSAHVKAKKKKATKQPGERKAKKYTQALARLANDKKEAAKC